METDISYDFDYIVRRIRLSFFFSFECISTPRVPHRRTISINYYESSIMRVTISHSAIDDATSSNKIVIICATIATIAIMDRALGFTGLKFVLSLAFARWLFFLAILTSIVYISFNSESMNAIRLYTRKKYDSFGHYTEPFGSPSVLIFAAMEIRLECKFLPITRLTRENTFPEIHCWCIDHSLKNSETVFENRNAKGYKGLRRQNRYMKEKKKNMSRAFVISPSIGRALNCREFRHFVPIDGPPRNSQTERIS